MDYFVNIDNAITGFLTSNIPRNQIFTVFFSFFSLRGASFFIWIAVILFVLFLEEVAHPGVQKRDIKFVVIFLVSFIIAFFSSDIVVKNIIKRSRPLYLQAQVVGCPRDFSFPSTHAATAFAAATVLTAYDKKRRWFYFLIAGLIGLSRIYLQCHYFFDVVGGGLLGIVVAKTSLRLDKLLFKKPAS